MLVVLCSNICAVLQIYYCRYVLTDASVRCIGCWFIRDDGIDVHPSLMKFKVNTVCKSDVGRDAYTL